MGSVHDVCKNMTIKCSLQQTYNTPPALRPKRPYFSSGPTAKPPGWTLKDLTPFFLQGRSHRSNRATEQLQDMLSCTQKVLRIPSDYELIFIPGSATGAMQTALWNFLGLRGIDMWVSDTFGQRWCEDVAQHLKIADMRVFESPWGHLPSFQKADFARDQVFVWNGTSSGLCMQNTHWIPDKRDGLTFCDATSAVLCMDLPWQKFDITAFSWQKGFGGEAGVGMLALSPRAMAQLRDYQPLWPVPRHMRLKKGAKLNTLLFQEAVPLNTLSMLSVADMMHNLCWIEEEGGLQAMCERVRKNNAVLDAWVQETPFIDYVVKDPLHRSASSVCLAVTDTHFTSKTEAVQWQLLEEVAKKLAQEKVAFDCLGHPHGKPCLRLWCGPTVCQKDLSLMLPWLAWSVSTIMHENKKVFFSKPVDAQSASAYNKEKPYHSEQGRGYAAGMV